MKRQTKVDTFILQIIHAGAAPVTYVLRVIHPALHNKKLAHITVGSVVACIGSWLASAAPHIAPAHFEIIVEAIAWGIHGIGIAPIVKIVADKLKLE